MAESSTVGSSSSRRQFILLAGTGVLAGGIAGCSSVTAATQPGLSNEDPSLVRSVHQLEASYCFRAQRTAGVVAPSAPHGVVVGLDVRSANRAALSELLDALSSAIDQTMSGAPYQQREGGFPPLDTGILGPDPEGHGISVVVGFGESLFDNRFGLADHKPDELQRMPVFLNDILIDQQTSHGDLSITVNGADQDAVEHTLRQILRAGRGMLIPKWSKSGYNSIIPDATNDEAPVRNLMGFKDGSANPAATDDVLDELVWLSPNDSQPAWAVGGTYQAIRVIRMQVEFWDRTRLNEQEVIFGRKRDSGAPLGGTAESQDPSAFEAFDLESHIGRANPRDGLAKPILRRGFSYSSGFDGNSQLDQGLIFVSYQRSLEEGFIAAQRRLDGEVLEEYVRPIHGGLFFVPPPPPKGEYLGQQLIEM